MYLRSGASLVSNPTDCTTVQLAEPATSNAYFEKGLEECEWLGRTPIVAVAVDGLTFYLAGVPTHDSIQVRSFRQNYHTPERPVRDKNGETIDDGEGKKKMIPGINMDNGYYQMHEYQAPAWAQHLNHIPSHIVKLTSLNTPIHRWSLPGVPDGFQVFIKRDDLTGAELSGSKVRILQFLFAEALRNNARHVVTGGCLQSNHCRAVALTCRQLGLTPHIVVARVSKV
ncbi:uncharacterized protein LOC127870115 [Dreissena polymorpha]|uniref:uncharacterized protein LOC127870115 n=1 Tax=Dreissena polymorpha TaxID=45954 RepID=UPI0022646601|nr:uncharacterized protein LOC127870115 [Dreissena polymorpha]